MKIYLKYLCFVLLWFTVFGCAGSKTVSDKKIVEMRPGITLLSDKVKEELREMVQCITGINTKVFYNIYTYNYVMENGQFVPDPESSLKYKLETTNGKLGIDVDEDDKTISGAGLILDVNYEESKYLILTNNHLVAPQEITEVYYPDENGYDTDVLFARYAVKKVEIAVRGNNNRLVEAKLIANDAINDLALLEVESFAFLGRVYNNDIDYDLELSWGDWVFLFGYPRGIKQMTGGWVSEAPYSNTLTVDAVVRFGYSGGPVFAISRDNAKLVFAGMIKSVPRNILDYVAPDDSWPVGYPLSITERGNMTVKRELLVDYGTAYFVNSKTIKEFFYSNKAKMKKAGIRIPPKYFGK